MQEITEGFELQLRKFILTLRGMDIRRVSFDSMTDEISLNDQKFKFEIRHKLVRVEEKK